MTPLAMLVNGTVPVDADHAIAINDRGLSYGDGLFETTLLRDGAVRFLQAHLQRLQQGCERLGMAYPAEALMADIRQVSATAKGGVLKIIVTRGAGSRGYRPQPDMSVTRIVTLHPLPESGDSALSVRWCDLRLSRNQALAGMKHLNRLEQVLAQREWTEEQSGEHGIGEGLMLDTEGELVSGTASNVFLVRKGALLTPDLRFCGVRGVMRAQILRVAKELGLQHSEEPLWPHDLDDATEVFMTNAVRGIRCVVALENLRWKAGPVARQLATALDL